ncbi:VWFA and cache domain-containing protein 1 [Lates japonicus]|uniref:VWFA and cache domain-containing protein 1 n=1 Tax=Lates japonicus TaxID=270547 RepID=A0AAD3M903_LATJO|nr:VWFA and cache domain-containing protein 1 [Lates japonicus]
MKPACCGEVTIKPRFCYLSLLERIFNSFVYTEKTSNGETEVQQLAKKIREKFNRYLDVVNRNKQVVEASYTAHLTSPLTAIQDCCSIPASMME